MTTLQLKVAIAIGELGSISAAANKLEISQPNASSYLKLLEEEIGFEIFNRTKQGTSITEKGHSFLEHAKIIILENECIMSISKHEDIYRLRLGSSNYYTSIEPFIKLCEKHRDNKEVDFKYLNVSIDNGIKELNNYNLDIMVAPILKTQVTGTKNLCQKQGVEIISLCELPALIFVRKDHPAALDGRCMYITRGSDVMKEFPYVAYRNLDNDTSSTGYNDSDFIPCSCKIFVDARDVRFRIISTTNAFTFGVMPSKSVKEKYDLATFPVQGINLEVFCFIRKGEKNKREIQEYISLLKDEIITSINNK